MSNDMLKQVQILQQYMHAMKDGDIETVATLLEDAEQDRALENMFLEVNAIYQDADNIPIQPNDIVQAQHLMRTIACQTTRSDTMQRLFFQAEDDSAQIPTVGTTPQPRSADQVRPGRNTLTPAFPARAATKQTWYRSPKGRIAALAAAILLFFVLLQSNGVLASQIFSFFHQVKPIIMDLPGDHKPYVSANDLGSFSNQSGFFGQSSANMPHHLTKTQVMHAINFPLMLPGQLPEDLKNVKPAFSLIGGGYATFTFNSAKTRAYLAKNGYRNVPISANLDGATFRVGRANGVQLYYQNQDGSHILLFSEGPLYSIKATGNASVKNLDDFLLLLPSLSPVEKAEFMQNNGDIVVPGGTGTQNTYVEIRSVAVHHVLGFLVSGKRLEDPILLWVENGIQYRLSGERGMNASQMLALANSFHS